MIGFFLELRAVITESMVHGRSSHRNIASASTLRIHQATRGGLTPVRS
jgi:hypothetical protein